MNHTVIGYIKQYAEVHHFGHLRLGNLDRTETRTVNVSFDGNRARKY